ncbi:MAG: hypothetical protein CBC84_001395 [Pelagibacteraceae bacterium TMED124]|nr:hypothetical protein [Candidatus Neomarinimicrobiota bacterium]RPG18583.1 MAG: hypothetical protein CBC84_001395 [Pelagibacteraceae bacterium TMED124]|tara:strand:- start:6954 stop:7223 length:270 start_codon:yes stop_codon:yes gene_type:complete
MDFDVTNIESENIDAKAVFPVIFIFILLIISSLVFVYYYFVFEKQNIMNNQYLEAPSKIWNEYDEIENKKIKEYDLEESMKKVLEGYGN